MTVIELIEKLKTYPENSTVAVIDADTGWFLHVDSVNVVDSYVCINSNYTGEIVEDKVAKKSEFDLD